MARHSRSRSRSPRRRHRTRSRSRSRGRDCERSRSPRGRDRGRSRSRSRAGDRREPQRRRSRWSPQQQEQQHLPPPPPLPLPPPPPPAPPRPSQILQAIVRSVVPFGVFVELLQKDSDFTRNRGPRPLQALVHASAVSDETSRLSRDDDEGDRRRALEFFAPIGSTVWVKIVDVKHDEGGGGRLRVSASMRAVSQQDGSDLDPEGKMMMPGFDRDRGGGNEGGNRSRNNKRPMSPPGDGSSPLSPLPPALGAVLRARVASTTKFGAFVLLEGFSGKGLIHITQIAEGLDMARLKEATDEEKEAAVREMLPVGSDLFVKIVDVVAARIDEETGAPLPAKVSCSAKVVDQSTGRDLDPTGERAATAGGGKGGGAKAAAAAAAAAAGAVAQRGDAVEWGHLAAEKYRGAPGNVDYDLVEETAEEAAAAAAAAVAAEEAAQRAEEELRDRGGGALPPPPPPAITSVEAALAVLEQLGGGGGKKKHKKDKKSKKKSKKKEKKSKHYHHKEKRRSRPRSSPSSSSSGSE